MTDIVQKKGQLTNVRSIDHPTPEDIERRFRRESSETHTPTHKAPSEEEKARHAVEDAYKRRVGILR